MSDSRPNTGEHVAAVLSLVSRALLSLAEDDSAPAVHCEAQARAARAALLTVCGYHAVGDASRVAAGRGGDKESTPESGDNPAALLAAAEREIARLPSQYRNQIAVCAASSYLRRARRALADS